MQCSCTISLDLIKTCYARRNKRGRCRVISEEKAATIAPHRVYRYYSERQYASCCSRLFRPVGVHEDCVANLLKSECRYEVVDKITGEDCKHPYGMVGKK